MSDVPDLKLTLAMVDVNEAADMISLRLQKLAAYPFVLAAVFFSALVGAFIGSVMATVLR